ncbi:MAG: tetratricopeptide repeat protein [Acidimicrobiia bacterium]
MIHPLLRDAVVADLPLPARIELHQRIAEELEALASRTGRNELTLSGASHRLAAFHTSRSIELAGPAASAGLNAGGQAFRMFATTSAVRLLEAALEAYETATVSDRDHLRARAFRGWLDLGNCQVVAGEPDPARVSYQKARRIADTAVEEAYCVRSLAWLDYREGRMAEAETILRRGLSTLPEDEPFARALFDLEIAWTQHRRGQFENAQPRLERVALYAEEGGDWPLAARALDRLAMNLASLGRPNEALDALGRAEALNRGKDNHRQGILLIHRASVLRDLGRPDEALPAVIEGISILESSHDDYTVSVGHWIAAEIHDRRGDLQAAEAARSAEIALLEKVGNNFNLARAHAHRAGLLRRLGRGQESHRAAEKARTAAALTADASLISRVEKRLTGGNTAGTGSL